MKTVVILGSAHPFRGGGIVTFNERLARQFQRQGYQTIIYNFSLQYPTFLFPGKSQYTDQPPPKDLQILSKLNSINPFNWLRVGLELRKKRPDLIVVRFWLPFMGASLGSVLQLARRNKHTRIVAITDNVIPHEKRPGDSMLTRYFLSSCDAFITMSEKVLADLHRFVPGKPATRVLHPLYDNFGEKVARADARQILGITPDAKLVLFFGFIRKYKGLDMLLEALHLFRRQIEEQHIRLMIAGEFYEDPAMYEELISRFHLSDLLVLKTGYISDEDVKLYFSATDVVIQPYRNATQSGVTPLAYHFETPMIVTNVGGLPSYVPDGLVGLVAEPNAQSIGLAILRFFELGKAHFIPHLRNEKSKYSWRTLVDTIVELGNRVAG